MTITDWNEGVRLTKELRETSHKEVPGYIKDSDLPRSLGHYVLDVPKQVLTPREIEITEQDATDLTAALQTGKLTSTEVTKAFLRRASLAQKLVNPVSEFLGKEALRCAGELDEYFQKHGKPIGPLHGLPISVKDHIGMKGKSQSLGMTSMMDNVCDCDADILVMLRSLGAVFHVRTTQPQMLFSIDTSSPLWGSTVTPYNRNLTAGGSSGGEGALIGMRGSVLGLGTDIGGSVRVPAAHNGIYAFRVSARRTPYGGICLKDAGAEQILCIVGPMAVSLRDCTLLLKVLLNAEPWKIDPYVLRMPWREVPKRRDFVIGVMWNDGVVQPHPPVTRVFKESVDKLETAGIKLVEWKPWEHKRAWDIISSLYFSTNGKPYYDAMEASNEPWNDLTKWILPENPNAKERTPGEINALVAEREDYKKEYLRRLNEAGVDFIITPTTVGAAMPIQKSRYWNYTAQWNLLDYPAIVLPAGQVDVKKDVKDESYIPTSDIDKYFYDLYDPETFQSAPVSVQLVGRTYYDEELASAAEVIDEILRA